MKKTKTDHYTEKEALELFATHYETGEVIPMELVQKIKDSATFQEGMQTLRQLSFGLLDMAWHAGESPETINSVKKFEAKDVSELPCTVQKGLFVRPNRRARGDLLNTVQFAAQIICPSHRNAFRIVGHNAIGGMAEDESSRDNDDDKCNRHHRHDSNDARTRPKIHGKTLLISRVSKHAQSKQLPNGENTSLWRKLVGPAGFEPAT
mgnify:CR=1 FL=1